MMRPAIAYLFGSALLLLGSGVTMPCAMKVLLNGSLVSSGGCTLNLVTSGSPSGAVATAAAHPAISGTDIGFAPNSALYATFDEAHANPSFCASHNGTTAYTCSFVFSTGGKALVSYTLGMEVLLDPDVTCSTSCTVGIDTATNGSGQNAITITQANGTTPPTGTLIAGQAHRVWYDGTVFRME